MIAKPKRNLKMRIEPIENGRAVPKAEAQAWLLNTSQRFRERQSQRRVERAVRRNGDSPERLSVAKAMLAVEDKLVRAFWTIARQPAGRIAPTASARNGLDYYPEGGDLGGYADAAGGKWDSVAPRPPIPGSREIDQASEALDWLLFVDESRRKILVAGATSKRGDLGRQVNWARLRQGMPELVGLSQRTCQGRYREALRIIVNELTLANLAK